MTNSSQCLLCDSHNNQRSDDFLTHTDLNFSLVFLNLKPLLCFAPMLHHRLISKDDNDIICNDHFYNACLVVPINLVPYLSPCTSPT